MNVQSLCGQLHKTGCLAFCYARIATDGYGGAERDRDIHCIKRICFAQEIGLLEGDFTVKDAAKLIHTVNPLVKASVEKRKISSLEDVKAYEYACVNYVYGNKNHWIWVKYGQKFYNPLDYSECVAKGNPVDARIVTIKEV